ncbi:MAG: thioesterase family protein [Planctomycetaceae bacterium]
MSGTTFETQFTTTRRVEFADTDMAGIIHFSNFYLYMAQAEHDYYRALGLQIMATQPDGSVIGWPRVSSKCRFLAPAVYDDLLEIRVSVVRRGVKSMTFRFEFWRSDVHIASGETKTVCCRLNHGAPLESIEIPPDYTEKLVEAAVVDPRPSAAGD